MENLITFEFAASPADGSARAITIRVTVEDDGSPMCDIQDDAEEKAHAIAAKKFGTQDIELVSCN
jgi:hypothetical protein